MSPLDRIRLSHTSKSWRAAFEKYHLHVLSKFILRYFPASPLAKFRALQAETGMVISGSAAIQVLENEIWDESDLDLYVEHQNVEPVATFVLSQLYNFQPGEKQIENAGGRRPTFEESYVFTVERSKMERWHDYNFDGIAAVYTFTRGTKKVQIISTQASVVKLILSFHSSACLKFYLTSILIHT
jgi:hypothetical protein